MWIADGWQDYELLDCGGGEKLERWGRQVLVRPDPQAIWNTPRRHPGWQRPDGRYFRSSSGGGHWEKGGLPQQWQVRYRDLTFQVKPMNFKHTGLFPEQAVNWDFAAEKIRSAGRRINVLNLFAYTGAASVACAAAGAATVAAASAHTTSLYTVLFMSFPSPRSFPIESPRTARLGRLRDRACQHPKSGRAYPISVSWSARSATRCTYPLTCSQQ